MSRVRIPTRCVIPNEGHYQRMFAEYERSGDIRSALLASGVEPIHGSCHLFAQLGAALAKSRGWLFTLVTYDADTKGGSNVVPVINGVEYDLVGGAQTGRTEHPHKADEFIRQAPLGEAYSGRGQLFGPGDVDVQNAVITIESGSTWNEFVFTATIKGERVGLLTAAQLGDYLQVRAIGVKPKYHRKGLATKLYWAAYLFGRERGAILMSDAARSEGSEGFWQKQEKKGRAAYSPKEKAYIVKRETTSFSGE